MPHLGQDLGLALCLNIEPAKDTLVEEWDPWRKEFVGLAGQVWISKSECVRPGEIFLYFNGPNGGYLRTGYGSLTIKDDMIVFCTEKSKYEFSRIEI